MTTWSTARETAKTARDPQDLALRGRTNKEVTKRVHQQVAEAVGLHSGDELIGIGTATARCYELQRV